MKASISILMTLALVGACDDDDNITPIGAEGDLAFFAADIAGYAPFDYITGSAEITTVIGSHEFDATVSIFDDQPDSIRPWKVRVGSCANSFEDVGQHEDYPLLFVGANGSATVSTTIFHELDPNKIHHVQFYLSPELNSHDDVLACGDLILQ